MICENCLEDRTSYPHSYCDACLVELADELLGWDVEKSLHAIGDWDVERSDPVHGRTWTTLPTEEIEYRLHQVGAPRALEPNVERWRDGVLIDEAMPRIRARAMLSGDAERINRGAIREVV